MALSINDYRDIIMITDLSLRQMRVFIYEITLKYHQIFMPDYNH